MAASSPKLIFCVTNQLLTDQRMQRICGSLSAAGYEVELVGVRHKDAPDLPTQNFGQTRLFCRFRKGPAFYVEYNLKLLWFLLFVRCELICAIDLDTILPVWMASWLRRKQRVYDAHEIFTEMEEVRRRPTIYKMWRAVEAFALPRFPHGYTVNQFIQQEFKRRYGVDYGIIRNLPLQPFGMHFQQPAQPPFLLYQGAVNEGRSFETLIPAMKRIPMPLVICGHGNLMQEVRQWVVDNGLQQKVAFKGIVAPQHLARLTPTAFAGLTLFQADGMNQYYSLANRFFDYMMAGIPQICVNYPEYKAINDVHGFALMIDDVEPGTIATAANKLMNDAVLYGQLQANAQKAAETLHWGGEAGHLLSFYQTLMPGFHA